jgi:hypothetical protein
MAERGRAKLPGMFRLAPLLAILFSLACGGGGNTSPVDAAPMVDVLSPTCMEAMDHSDLDWLQENVLNDSCASFTVCHKGMASSAGGLNLEAGNTANELINQPSQLFPDWDLVVPGSPADSYLQVILGQIDGPLDSNTGTMPLNSPLLCKEKLDAFDRWIQSL